MRNLSRLSSSATWASLMVSSLSTAEAWAPFLKTSSRQHWTCSSSIQTRYLWCPGQIRNFEFRPTWCYDVKCNILFRLYSVPSLPSEGDAPSFGIGDQVQVEVVSFGPMGASVEVVGMGHDGELLPVGEEPYGLGLILQKEIGYFRQSRGNVDVVRGEVLPAFVQKIRDDGKLDIGLREFGGKAKSDSVSSKIIEALEANGGTLDIGDKSAPEDINKVLPGVSKSVFKKAVGALYKKGIVSPSPKSINLTKK